MTIFGNWPHGHPVYLENWLDSAYRGRLDLTSAKRIDCINNSHKGQHADLPEDRDLSICLASLSSSGRSRTRAG